jgi:hypothetical protein
MNESQTAVALVPAELTKALQSLVIAEDGRRSLAVAFAPHFQRFADLRESAKGVAIDAPKAARTLRLELKAIRVAAEKTRKEQKEDSLRRGKAIDGIYNVLEYELAPVENAMEEIEKAEERREAARIAALKADRSAQLAPYADATFYDLGNMPAPQWEQLLAGAKAAHEAKIAAAAKAEADRIAAELAAKEAQAKREADEAAERERMRAENERLAKVAAEERAAREEAERKATQERAALEAKAKAEREAAAKAREEAEKLATAEKAHRESIEAAIRAKEEAEAKRIADEKAAAKKAAAAPDKQKLHVLATGVRSIMVPALSSEAGAALRVKIAEQVEKMAKWIESEAARL